MKLSVIIPAQKEPFVQRTLDSLLESSELGGQLEAIVVWDGVGFEEPIREDDRVRVVRLAPVGMRGAINAGIEAAEGEFIMKLDAHCLVDRGFDRVMVENCLEDWVAYPRRYSLDDEIWDRDLRRSVKDSFHLAFPTLGKNGYGLSPASCREWDRKVGTGNVLDSMIFEGCCWVANKAKFLELVGFLDDRVETYGPYHSESTEIAMSYWLGGGEVKAVTTTWFAHLMKRPRHYQAGLFLRGCKDSNTYTWATKHWMNDEHGKPKPFSWLIDKFWPVPGWPSDWKTVWDRNLARLEGGCQ